MALVFAVLAHQTLGDWAKWAKDEREAQADYSYAAESLRRLDTDLLGKYLAQSTLEYAKNRPVSFGDSGVYPNMLPYLMSTPGYRYQAGFERQLRAWIMEQPHNSIDPVKIYRKGLELAGGDIQLALLGIHELLRNEARFFNARCISYCSDYDQRREFFERFIDLRGDLKERGGAFRGDHFGTWYRFFGMLLYSVHRSVRGRESKALVPVPPNGLTTPVRAPRRRLYFTAVAAELYKLLVFWPEPDKLKVVHNLRAARTGVAFLRALARPDSLEGLPSAELRPYLSQGRAGYGLCLRGYLRMSNILRVFRKGG